MILSWEMGSAGLNLTIPSVDMMEVGSIREIISDICLTVSWNDSSI